MKIVVGLGNPGREYGSTRHNLGFMVVDKFAAIHSFSFTKKKFKSHLATGTVDGERVVLAKPQTFMNLSGDAVGPLVRFYARPLSDLLVVYDDIDIPIGKLRLRPSGGSGGHKGMASIIATLGSEEFPRLRLGIRGSRAVYELSGYVLSGFAGEEKTEIEKVVERACEAVGAVLAGPFEKAMNEFN